jgi:hypothetical protein
MKRAPRVADWLEKLGLGKYAQRFVENDIDFALFTKLTDDDLKELGVISLGHRKRLLEAIAERVAPPPTLAESKAGVKGAGHRHWIGSTAVG